VVRGSEVGEVSVYEPRQKVRGKPDLNVIAFFFFVENIPFLRFETVNK
jgi:hypothetical protein